MKRSCLKFCELSFVSDASEILYFIQAEIIDGFLMAIWDEKLRIKINDRLIGKKEICSEDIKRELTCALPYRADACAGLTDVV